MKLSERQLEILTALATYRYLTVSQLVLLKLGHPSSLRSSLRAMGNPSQRSPLVKTRKFSVAQFGRREHVHTLTKAGARMVEQLGGLAPESIPSSMYEADFEHRTSLISFRIRLDLALTDEGGLWEIEKYCAYYEKTGANHRREKGARLRTATKVEYADGRYIKPDALFLLKHLDGRSLGFALEMVCGLDRKRTIAQVFRNLKAIEERLITRQLNLPPDQGSAVLFVFLHRSQMERVLQELSRHPDFLPYRSYALFATREDTTHDALRCWRRVGDQVALYSLLDGKISYRLPTST